MKIEMQEVKVVVPTDRLSDFYRLVADWNEGLVGGRSEADGQPVEAVQDNVGRDALSSAAERWWSLLRPNERKIFGLWADVAPKLMFADDIVDRLGLNGPREIPGSLSWSSRKADQVGLPLIWVASTDPVSGRTHYGLCDVGDIPVSEYAEILRKARATVEG